MIQLIFFTLFIITLIAGAYTYFVPEQRHMDPVKFMMENSGYNSVEVLNRKRSEELNVSMNQGLLKVRGQMVDLALEQNNILDTIKEQQQILKSTGREVSDMMMEAEQKGEKGKDILQLRALASEIQDDQRLLVAQGQNLITLNNQVMQDRKSFADQINLVNINNEASLNTLQQGYARLKDQAAVFFDKVNQHNQQVRDQMDRMRDQLKSFPNNAALQQSAQENIGRMLDQEHEAMIRLADSQEKSRELLKDDQEKLADSQELMNDKLQQNQDALEEERQRIEDQKQRMQDQEDQQNR